MTLSASMAAVDTMTPQIQLSNISYRYGKVTALDDLSLAVGQGEIVSLVGPSGCGKSTLMRVIAGLAAPQTGQITIAGDLMFDGAKRNVPAERRGVGLVFQDYALFPHLNALKNVAFGLHRLNRAARRQRAQEMLNLVGLGKMAARYPHELSGGQQQRVALARALAPEPAVLLMDEPFSGLDTQTRGRVREQVIGVLRQTQTTALIVTHDPEEAMQVGDRVAVMNHGQLAQLGTAAQVYEQPNNAFVASLFGDINRLPASVDDMAVTLPGGITHPDPWAEPTPPVALIRPERLKINADLEAARLQVTVVSSRVNGPDMTLSLTIGTAEGGDPLTLRLDMAAGRSLKPGQVIGVDFALEDVHLVAG